MPERRLAAAHAAMPIPVLLYHRVADTNDPFGLGPAAFTEQVASLRQQVLAGWVPLRISELAAGLRGEASLPPRAFAVTFDDGFADTVDAVQTLAAVSIPSTVYVTTGYLNRPSMLSRDALRELAREPLVEIGAHTVRHPRLDELPIAAVAQEVGECRAELEELSGSAVLTFAYPHGAYDGRVQRVVSDAGFRSACAVKNACSHSLDDPLAIARWTLKRGSGLLELEQLFLGAGPAAWRRTRLRTAAWRTARRLARRVSCPII